MEKAHCEQISELLDLYISDELPSEEREAVQAHLASCADCRKEYEFLLGLKKAAQEMEMPPCGLHEKIMAAVRSKKVQAQKRYAFLRRFSCAAAVFLLAVLIGGGVLANRWQPPSQSPSDIKVPRDAFSFCSGTQDTDISAPLIENLSGKWQFVKENGVKVTLSINREGEAMVCVTDSFGLENTYDGILKQEKKHYILQQSDGTHTLYACLTLTIQNGKLYICKTSGKVPWDDDAIKGVFL